MAVNVAFENISDVLEPEVFIELQLLHEETFL